LKCERERYVQIDKIYRGSHPVRMSPRSRGKYDTFATGDSDNFTGVREEILADPASDIGR
jgi:hypothetical protein